jgi:hypothetical protein
MTSSLKTCFQNVGIHLPDYDVITQKIAVWIFTAVKTSFYSSTHNLSVEDSYELTPWSWVLEKPLAGLLLKNFPTFYGTRRLTRACHWSLFRGRLIPKIYFIIHLYLGLGSGLFPEFPIIKYNFNRIQITPFQPLLSMHHTTLQAHALVQ